MEGKTHVIGGLAAGLAVASLTNADPILVTAAAAFGSLVPDIDHGGSKISRSNAFLALLSAAVNLLFMHRGFTHSILFTGLVAWVLTKLGVPPDITLGTIVGILSHLFLDCVTKRGIKLFYPLQTTFKIPLNITTGGAVEKVVMVLLGIAVCYFATDILI